MSPDTSESKMTRPRGACQVCLMRYRLLKLGGWAVGKHNSRHGSPCPGSNRQPIPRTVRGVPNRPAS